MSVDFNGPIPLLVAGEWEAGERPLQVHPPYDRDVRTAFRAFRELEVGGVIVGDVPSYRADSMPYGGVKESGVGREGVRYAMTDLTYERVMVLAGLSL